MAIQANIYDSFEAFDRQYEAEHAAEIAFENGRIDWENVTPQNAAAIIFSVTLGSACRVMQILAGGKSQ